jgi:hypothetical protein
MISCQIILDNKHQISEKAESGVMLWKRILVKIIGE